MADPTPSGAGCVLPPEDGIDRRAAWVEEAIATHDIRAGRRARAEQEPGSAARRTP